MFLVWLGCDLFVNYLVWYYCGQVRSELVCFSYCLVSFGVVWCDFYIFLALIDVLLCDLGVIWFWVIWCDITEVRLGLICFLFVVIWCLLMSFGVLCIFLGGNQWFLVRFGCDLFLNDLVWYYWGQVRSDFICFWCCLVSYVWVDLE